MVSFVVYLLMFSLVGWLCFVIFILDQDLVVVRTEIRNGYGIGVISGFLVDLLLDLSAS